MVEDLKLKLQSIIEEIEDAYAIASNLSAFTGLQHDTMTDDQIDEYLGKAFKAIDDILSGDKDGYKR